MAIMRRRWLLAVAFLGMLLVATAADPAGKGQTKTKSQTKSTEVKKSEPKKSEPKAKAPAKTQSKEPAKKTDKAKDKMPSKKDKPAGPKMLKVQTKFEQNEQGEDYFYQRFLKDVPCEAQIGAYNGFVQKHKIACGEKKKASWLSAADRKTCEANLKDFIKRTVPQLKEHCNASLNEKGELVMGAKKPAPKKPAPKKPTQTKGSAKRRRHPRRLRSLSRSKTVAC